jgi:hypothetical protein
MQEQCDICTFRNNLNKIFGTPLELKSSWTVDACSIGPITYLDIHQLPQTTYPDADLFQYYGYKYAFPVAICNMCIPEILATDYS